MTPAPAPPPDPQPELLELLRRFWPEISALGATLAAAAVRYRAQLAMLLRRLLAIPPVPVAPAPSPEPRPPIPGASTSIDPARLAVFEERQRRREADEEADQLVDRFGAVVEKTLRSLFELLREELSREREAREKEMRATRDARLRERKESRDLLKQLSALVDRLEDLLDAVTDQVSRLPPVH